MPHPLEQKIIALRRRLRWLTAIHAVSWIVAAVVAAVLVLGMIDYVCRFQDRGIRAISSLVVLAVLGWTSYRYLLRGLSARLRNVELALRLQRRFSQLGDSLASAVEFLGQSEDDPTAGSVALRRAVIAKTTAEADSLDFSDVLDVGPTLLASFSAATVCLLATILVVIGWPDSQTALARLANPLSNAAWLQKTHLAVVQREVRHDRVAWGQAFEIEVVDARGAALPSDIRIHYRFETPDGRIEEETDSMRLVGDTAVARRENVTRSFSFRVEGGDDNSMDWLGVEVVEPPAIDSLSIELVPPDYTGFPVETAGKPLRALVGTHVRIAGRATRPLASAALCLDSGLEIPLRLGEDGLAFSLHPGDASEPSWVVEQSGAYWFRLIDREGLSSDQGTRWEIRAIPDAPPSVTIEQPASTVYVTPRAVVPLKVTVKDDLALRRVELVAERPDLPGKAPWAFPLYEGLEKVEPSETGFSEGTDLGESRPIEYAWDLAALQLRPGTQVVFRVTATDYLPQTGRSEPRRLAIISPEELSDRIASRQGVILAELARVLQMQRESRSQVAVREIQLHEFGQLDQLAIDRLRGAELNQRQVVRSLTSRSEGVPMHVLGLLADLENNKVDSPEVKRRMELILAEIDRLQREHFPVIGRELTAAIKAAQVHLDLQPNFSNSKSVARGARVAGVERSEPPEIRQTGGSLRSTPATADPNLSMPLQTAGRHQDKVIESLEQMLGRLAQWDNYRRFHRDIGRLLREQEELGRRGVELARRTLTRQFKNLSPREKADLAVLGREQLELARQLDRTLQEMDQAVGHLEKEDPLAAETVSDALHRGRQLATSGTMRSAAEDVARNRMGRALGRQKQVVEELEEVLDILSNRREGELGRLIKKLREAESDLADLAGRQQGLYKRMEAAAAASEKPDQQEQHRRELKRLGRDQAALKEETKRAGRRLERLMARRAGETTKTAAEHMDQAAQGADRGAGQAAKQQADRAARQLDDAREQLAGRRRQAEIELAMEQLARLQDTLTNLHRRQTGAIDETGRLDGLRQSQGQLTVAQQTTLIDLARQQRLLQIETAGLARKLTGAKVFTLALTGAADEMTRAAHLLAQQQTGPPTQQAEQNALQRLAQLLQALEPEEPTEDKNPGNSGGTGGGGKGMPGGGIRTLAELKLLKIMQEEINLRTRQLQGKFGGPDKLDKDARREYERLSGRQGELADLLLEMIRPETDPEENPDLLPESNPKSKPEDKLPLLPLEEDLP